ncbi:uncharacterized protein LOC106637839 [Copidosoma floridanum]|uniref:uncharacterized protein LOC106637839 n=1 Tax=Copidosoma floridanum TaxID=29053 RepID=UPI0006C99475|nr:uncharacterized protein LOC106637839 [Copidosoma floridanum]
MKSFAAVILLAVVCFVGARPKGFSDEENKMIMQHSDSCMVEAGVDKALTQYPFNEKGEMIQDEDFNCFLACMYKKIDVMKPDGTINEEVARSMVSQGLSQEKMHEAVKCIAQVGNNTCDTAGKLLGCVMKIRMASELN